ncbi:hypothetical protein DFJ58DRAFT_837304 [Suillus subalutaceus]|uniref:uncharacterized protein n=1 Tax=Suillus subalutaceus TaxID=48586 RepID=UPI001B87C8AF|nr:uncharacterized protein DFJ58DRAFT_837304 [Suillus subalutaceus]KAG1871352.1 hypothetical protein DFJ58DRAFT_837304 [Suillus subalutaceus]
MPSNDISNEALSDATAQVLQILARALKLKEGHADHMKITVEMGNILSPNFAKYGMSATLIHPVLLSVAMELLEHLDPSQKNFVSAPEWKNIKANDPRIKKHPLAKKARRFSASGPIPEDTLPASQPAAGIVVPAPTPAPASSSKPKSKARPLPRRKKVEELRLEGDGIEIVPAGNGGDVAPAANKPSETAKVKGKGKGKGKGKAKDDEVECAQVLGILKRRWESTPSRSPMKTDPTAEQQPMFGDRLPLPMVLAKKQKVAQSLTTEVGDLLKEDVNADNDGPELVPRYMLESDDARSGPVLSGASTSVLVPILNPPSDSLLDHMEVDMLGDSMLNELQAMTLEVRQDSTAMRAKSTGLQDTVNHLRSKLDKLEARNLVTTDLVKVMNKRIANQELDIVAMEALCTELSDLHQQVKVLQDDGATHDQQLRRAEEQLARQERTTGLLQDSYNALCQRIMAPNQSFATTPFPNGVFLTNIPTAATKAVIPLSVAQTQALEALYLNMLTSASGLGGPFLGNVAGGSQMYSAVSTNVAGGSQINSVVGTNMNSVVGTNVAGGSQMNSVGTSNVVGSADDGGPAFGDSASGIRRVAVRNFSGKILCFDPAYLHMPAHDAARADCRHVIGDIVLPVLLALSSNGMPTLGDTGAVGAVITLHADTGDGWDTGALGAVIKLNADTGDGWPDILFSALIAGKPNVLPPLELNFSMLMGCSNLASKLADAYRNPVTINFDMVRYADALQMMEKRIKPER